MAEMNGQRKYAYRYLLYWGMVEIRHLSWLRLRNLLRPGELRRIRRAGALAEWLHNLELFAATDFEGFDEEQFWNDGRSLEALQPGLGVEMYRHIFDQRMAEGPRD